MSDQQRGTTPRVLAEIAAERSAQDDKWGEQNHPDGTGEDRHLLRDTTRPTFGTLCHLQRIAADERHLAGVGTYADILLEEVFEAMASTSTDGLRAELVQVAAVAAAWVEAIDRRSRPLVSQSRPIEVTAEPSYTEALHACGNVQPEHEWGVVQAHECRGCPGPHRPLRHIVVDADRPLSDGGA